MQQSLVNALRLASLQSTFEGERGVTDSGGASDKSSKRVGAAPDDILSAAIAARLAAADDGEVDRVHVAVQRACVTLRGEVPTRRSMGRIEALIASCEGVMRIDNQMRVGYSH
ncbi:BON domain-containing protein [Robbsia sp. KACC 23696]|uniref:BON domain-containing protein n=1 Tax=Robbsia sp. KACC 23696 TaxID=3149231 RepID=UPI00325A4C2F